MWPQYYNYQGFSSILKIIWTMFIKKDYNNLLINYFDIEKT